MWQRKKEEKENEPKPWEDHEVKMQIKVQNSFTIRFKMKEQRKVKGVR
jgi:hypothetical protein